MTRNRLLTYDLLSTMAKVNKRRRSTSGDIDIAIGAEAGQQNGHEKRPPIHNFNRSSVFTIKIYRPIFLIMGLLGLLGLLSNLRNAFFNAQQITMHFQDEMQPSFNNDNVGEIFTTAKGKRQVDDQSRSSSQPPIISSSSSAIVSSSIQAQQCSSIGTTMSFGELVRTHYEKMQQQQQQEQQQQPDLSSNNNLKFVHIAKTGGTAIEMAAAAANISWGVCHWHNDKYYKHYTCPPSNEPSRVVPKNGGPPKIAYWHKTSQHYDVRFAATSASGKKNDNDNDLYDPYANASLFAVVRNPYNRIISEYYYETSRGNTPAFVLNNATRLNTWVQQLLRPLQGATMGFIQLVVVVDDDDDATENPNKNKPPILPANRNYYQRDSHYIPQYDYFYDGERRVVHHVIHFENLSHEFRALTVQYNLSQQIILPDINHASNTNTNNNKKKGQEMSGRHTQNKKLGMHNLTIENTRLVEFVYARDFVFFGYPTRTHLLENQYQPGANAGHRHRRLEFVHIPQTGGRMIEMAAAAAQIPWGACHFRILEKQQSLTHGNDKSHQDDELSWCPVANDGNNMLDPNVMHKLLPAQLKEMKNHLWHLPSHYFEKLLSPDTSSPKLQNPYGDDNTALFVVVRNPYDRVISTYYAVQEKEQKQTSNNGMMMNNATYMNEWLYRHLTVMRDTISTARQVNATSFPKPPYYQFAGRFMPQYDFVYDFVYDGNQGQRRVVDHVLHFESLATEFSALMNDYYSNHSSNDQGRHRHRRPVLPEIKAADKLEALLECTKSLTLGIANLTLQNVRLIELVYARDFAAFGYKSMTFHLENQYPLKLPLTDE